MNRSIDYRALVFAMLLAVPTGVVSQAVGPRVKTRQGMVEGKQDAAVHAFLGIPYAEPPVGDLRWKAPLPAAKWNGVRKATDFGSHCLQGRVYGDMNFRDSGGSEDCLTLNVWLPAKPRSAKLPVMVWIYGGGFVNGGSSPPVYDGSAFARDGIVLVSFNYRLGNFGFFAHPALSAEQHGQLLGNYAYMDQIAALRWVRRNIAAFVKHFLFAQAMANGRVLNKFGQSWHSYASPFAAASNARLTATLANFTL